MQAPTTAASAELPLETLSNATSLSSLSSLGDGILSSAQADESAVDLGDVSVLPEVLQIVKCPQTADAQVAADTPSNNLNSPAEQTAAHRLSDHSESLPAIQSQVNTTMQFEAHQQAADNPMDPAGMQLESVSTPLEPRLQGPTKQQVAIVPSVPAPAAETMQAPPSQSPAAPDDFFAEKVLEKKRELGIAEDRALHVPIESNQQASVLNTPDFGISEGSEGGSTGSCLQPQQSKYSPNLENAPVNGHTVHGSGDSDDEHDSGTPTAEEAPLDDSTTTQLAMPLLPKLRSGRSPAASGALPVGLAGNDDGFFSPRPPGQGGTPMSAPLLPHQEALARAAALEEQLLKGEPCMHGDGRHMHQSKRQVNEASHVLLCRS